MLLNCESARIKRKPKLLIFAVTSSRGLGAAAHRVAHHKALHAVAMVHLPVQRVVDLAEELHAHRVASAHELVAEDFWVQKK